MKKRTPKAKPVLKAIYLEAVEAQLTKNDPPETRQTLDRLRARNISEGEAKVLIGSVVEVETSLIMRSGTPFNHERFVRNLRRLPDQNFDRK
jgi:hypothetical protein